MDEPQVDERQLDETGPEVRTAEGRDLRRLVEQLRERHGEISVLSHEQVRTGGLAGFFARESCRITYRVRATRAEPPHRDPAAELVEQADQLDRVETTSSSSSAQPDRAPLDRARPDRALSTADDDWHVEDALLDLLGSTDHRESALNGTAAELDFAQVLHTLTGGDDLELHLPSFEVLDPALDSLAVPPLDPRPQAPATGAGSATRQRMELLVQLREIGVPVLTGPAAGTDNVFQALADVLDELPAPPRPPRGAGELLVLVGDLAPTLRTAHAVAATLRLDPAGIRVAGHPGDPALALATRSPLTTPSAASDLRGELATAATPSVLVLASDGGPAQGEDPWAPAMLQALRPTAAWAVVDATGKTEDTRAWLRPLGADALCVHSSRHSASPATVWDLDLPVALLDGQPADTTAWAGLLFSLLRSGTRRGGA